MKMRLPELPTSVLCPCSAPKRVSAHYADSNLAGRADSVPGRGAEMTVLTILGSVAAIIVAAIAIWNTAPVSRQRVRMQRVIQERRERRQLAHEVASFASEPVLIEIEDRFDELVTAFESKQIPDDLIALWAHTFRLTGESPVGRPFRYGTLVVHRDRNAMTVQRGSDSITGQEWFDPYRIPLRHIRRSIPPAPPSQRCTCERDIAVVPLPAVVAVLATAWRGE